MLRGVYGVGGDSFITVRELALKSGASLVTAQKVMTMLQEEGLVGRKGRRNVILSLPPVPGRDGHLLGLLVTNLENPFFAQLAKQVENSARNRGFELITAGSDYDPEREREVLEMFARKGVGGVLACPCDSGSSGSNFAACSLPFVFIARRIAGVVADAVLVRNKEAGCDVARHLLECGYRNFAYVGVDNFASDPRRQGFFEELSRHGFRCGDGNVLLVDNQDIDASTRALTDFVMSQTKPVGMFCFHDLIAARLLKTAHFLGLNVPGDLAVVGFDNLPVSAELIPSLTTVAYPVDDMAELALDCLESLMNKKRIPIESNIYISPKLVIRESTRHAPVRESARRMVPDCMAYSIV